MRAAEVETDEFGNTVQCAVAALLLSGFGLVVIVWLEHINPSTLKPVVARFDNAEAVSGVLHQFASHLPRSAGVRPVCCIAVHTIRRARVTELNLRHPARGVDLKLQ